ncbi:MAG: MTH1187 family thiamine-binding protein [Desulfuromonadales bacterium]
MAVVEISVVPLGTATTSVSTYVAACVEVVAASGLNYRLTPMGTVVEGDLDDLLPVLRRLHEVPFQQGAQRVSTLLKIDDRRDREVSNFEQKITSVEDKLKSGS